jgi:formylglycine-generating enzyme required for sulfatase activity
VSSGQPEQARLIGWQLLDADQADTPDAYRTVVLVGEIVEELGGYLGRDGRRLRDDVVGDLVKLIEGGHLPARERVDAAFLLGRLTEGNDPRMATPDQPAYWCLVEAGTFWYGDDRPDDDEEELSPDEYEPKRLAKLEQVRLNYDFQIARYPVTNAEYACFIEADGYNPDQPWWTEQGRIYISPEGERRYEPSLKGKPITQPRLWDDSSYNNPAQPVVGVSWYEAAAYCRWLTQQGHTQGWLDPQQEIRLPTSLEWERAARHTDQRPYPWGENEPTPERANYKETGIDRPSPVGCFPAGAAVCGAQDMAGNVLEWLATPFKQRQQVEPEKDFATREGMLLAWSRYGSRKFELLCGYQIGSIPFHGPGGQGFRVIRFLGSSSHSR